MAKKQFFLFTMLAFLAGFACAEAVITYQLVPVAGGLYTAGEDAVLYDREYRSTEEPAGDYREKNRLPPGTAVTVVRYLPLKLAEYVKTGYRWLEVTADIAGTVKTGFMKDISLVPAPPESIAKKNGPVEFCFVTMLGKALSKNIKGIVYYTSGKKEKFTTDQNACFSVTPANDHVEKLVVTDWNPKHLGEPDYSPDLSPGMTIVIDFRQPNYVNLNTIKEPVVIPIIDHNPNRYIICYTQPMAGVSE